MTTGVLDSGLIWGDFLDLGWQIGTEVSQNLELKQLLFVVWTFFLIATFLESKASTRETMETFESTLLQQKWKSKTRHIMH